MGERGNSLPVKIGEPMIEDASFADGSPPPAAPGHPIPRGGSMLSAFPYRASDSAPAGQRILVFSVRFCLGISPRKRRATAFSPDKGMWRSFFTKSLRAALPFVAVRPPQRDCHTTMTPEEAGRHVHDRCRCVAARERAGREGTRGGLSKKRRLFGGLGRRNRDPCRYPATASESASPTFWGKNAQFAPGCSPMCGVSAFFYFHCNHGASVIPSTNKGSARFVHAIS